VRAVWNGDRWELHIVCKKEIPVEDAPGDNTAGIDLGISNYLAIDYEDGPSELYPGNVLKEDKLQGVEEVKAIPPQDSFVDSVNRYICHQSKSASVNRCTLGSKPRRSPESRSAMRLSEC